MYDDNGLNIYDAITTQCVGVCCLRLHSKVGQEGPDKGKRSIDCDLWCLQWRVEWSGGTLT